MLKSIIFWNKGILVWNVHSMWMTLLLCTNLPLSMLSKGNYNILSTGYIRWLVREMSKFESWSHHRKRTCDSKSFQCTRSLNKPTNMYIPDPGSSRFLSSNPSQACIYCMHTFAETYNSLPVKFIGTETMTVLPVVPLLCLCMWILPADCFNSSTYVYVYVCK